MSVTFSKLKNGTTYEFMVKYSVGGKISSDAYADKLTAKQTIENTATKFHSPRKKPVSATLTESITGWKAVPGAEKYAVYKYVNVKATKLAEIEKTSVTIKKLKSGKTYSYIVRAYVDGK